MRVEGAITKILLALTVAICLYCFIAFSNIYCIKYLRELYIETAMSTMTKQWLAYIFPKSVVVEVVSKRDQQTEEINRIVDMWKNIKLFNGQAQATPIKDEIDSEESFFQKFWEIDRSSFSHYTSVHPEVLNNGYENIYINDIENRDYRLKTIFGEEVILLDVRNNLLIARVTGSNHEGRLAIVKDPRQVKVAVSKKLGDGGQFVTELVKDNNALIGVNASGFADYGGHGNGGTVIGLLVADGRVYNKPLGGEYIMIGFDRDNNLRIGKFNDISMFRDAVEFRPALVVNGEKVVKDSAGWGLQPRTAIGQSRKGEVMLLVIDGRQVGYSIGATMEQCADIMLQHDALTAAAVDGGSSSIMVYNDKVLTRPSNGYALGRRVPDGFIVVGSGQR